MTEVYSQLNQGYKGGYSEFVLEVHREPELTLEHSNVCLMLAKWPIRL